VKILTNELTPSLSARFGYPPEEAGGVGGAAAPPDFGVRKRAGRNWPGRKYTTESLIAISLNRPSDGEKSIVHILQNHP
jgi:hypothetical protein